MTENEKFDLILSKLNKLDEIESKLEKVEDRLDKIEDRLDKIESRLGEVEGRLGEVEGRLDKVESRLDKVESRLDKIETDVADIKMILENEIRVNIRRVAEGHLDLSKNLHEALKVDNEKEMLSIRVTVLETELRRIKQQLEIA